MTFSTARFFGLLLVFLALAMPRAFSSEAFKEAWVQSHCKSASTYEEMHGLFAQGDMTAAMMYYRLNVGAGECDDYTQYGLVAAFVGERIAKRLEDPVQGKTVILEGYIVNADESRGEKAFIWVAEEHLGNFLESLDGKPVFQPEASEYDGWQDT